jgi:hypothetical protein
MNNCSQLEGLQRLQETAAIFGNMEIESCHEADGRCSVRTLAYSHCEDTEPEVTSLEMYDSSGST